MADRVPAPSRPGLPTPQYPHRHGWVEHTHADGYKTHDHGPSTKRGQHLLSELPNLIRGPWTPFREEQWTGTILAIEEAARTEGRQEAVRDAKAMLSEDDISQRDFLAILDEVAVLNASESPPTSLEAKQAAVDAEGRPTMNPHPNSDGVWR